MGIDNERNLRRSTEHEFEDFRCPECHSTDWTFIRRETRWAVACEDCDHEFLYVRPDIQKRSGDPADPVDIHTIGCLPWVGWGLIIWFVSATVTYILYGP